MKGSFIDQLGRKIELNEIPSRVVSTVPSQTELLYYLGLDSKIIAATWFCIHPENKTKLLIKIGGTKQLKTDIILSLEPDLIIANKEENTQEQIELLAQNRPVWLSDVCTLADNFELINQIGEIFNVQHKSALLIEQIQKGLLELQNQVKSYKKALYLIWKEPWMTVGKDTFINNMMQYAGYENVINYNRYPELSFADMQKINPEVVLLSSEPYPFKKEHIVELQNILPDAEIKLVDGEMFSWYGSRVLLAIDYFKGLNNTKQ